ncbi:HPt (histidine-containing phosphotransfer) domain-containing protein [Sphingomonas guangdongensis]|uniref:HPt (Histidine-containing phosphotransfer) domain-containing protein n=1 Tax=Sphingomonas guangdongensis TaxID=1141890 RepID=A0A285R4P7_9SPHN|nr:Hpt domain-containing protein [Sphingomonas guangdongensis]SOB87327.1 HPt (histidine-containing phosphotransfer) domain-containing protein [Sphingomonas guangdongensis]
MTVATNASLIDWKVLAAARIELGANFVRILGYFREDGEKAVGSIESAMRAQNAAALVIPAHTLKGEARQFGAESLAEAAETIEVIARDCVETRDTPDAALEAVAGLRALFRQTLELLERETSPLVERRPGFGRRAV